MRIATIPSALWEIPEMRATDPELVYPGRMPQTAAECIDAAKLFPHTYWPTVSAYAYVLLHVDGSAIYVGKARDPLRRFEKHRRREWWQEVYHLLLLRIEGATQADADALAFSAEGVCIRRLGPLYNVAGIIPRPMNKRGVFA